MTQVKRLMRTAPNVLLPLGAAVLLFVLWQTQVLHKLLGTDTITLPLPTRIGEIISQNTSAISGHRHRIPQMGSRRADHCIRL